MNNTPLPSTGAYDDPRVQDAIRNTIAAGRIVLEDREKELLDLKGPCSNARCRLHYAHSGPCDIRPASTTVDTQTGGPVEVRAEPGSPLTRTPSRPLGLAQLTFTGHPALADLSGAYYRADLVDEVLQRFQERLDATEAGADQALLVVGAVREALRQFDRTTLAPKMATTAPLACPGCGQPAPTWGATMRCLDCGKRFCGNGCHDEHRELGTCPAHADGVLTVESTLDEAIMAGIHATDGSPIVALSGLVDLAIRTAAPILARAALLGAADAWGYRVHHETVPEWLRGLAAGGGIDGA